MSKRTIHLALKIHDHLDDSVIEVKCIQALYDEANGCLSYIEQDTQTKVEIKPMDDGFELVRWGESVSNLKLSQYTLAPFSVGRPAIEGQAKLVSWHSSRSSIQLEYRLYVDDQIITHRSLMYTLNEADA